MSSEDLLTNEQTHVVLVDELIKTESSNIVNIAYQKSTKTAFVTFSKGTLYEYKDVELEDYEKLRDAQSVGRHLRSVFIKNGYEYSKLENTQLSCPILTEETIKEVARKIADE